MYIQRCIDRQTLGDLVNDWVAGEYQRGPSGNCKFLWWFRDRYGKFLDIPSKEQPYAYQIDAIDTLKQRFFGDPDAQIKLRDAEKCVFALYSILLRSFNNIPDVRLPEWIQFGFCYCSSVAQQRDLAMAYLDLLQCDLSLDQIATAWENNLLLSLMEKHKIDVPMAESNALSIQQPSTEDFGIYRLMVEVNHALSGSFCNCFRAACHNHSKHETLLSKESEVDYGFHGTNAWERWQLLNFYSHVFANPHFNAKEMQKARRDPNSGALELYLESLIPNLRQKLNNHNHTDAMFPKLGNRASYPYDRPQCPCIMHNQLTSKGLDLFVLVRITSIQDSIHTAQDMEDTIHS